MAGNEAKSILPSSPRKRGPSVLVQLEFSDNSFMTIDEVWFPAFAGMTVILEQTKPLTQSVEP